MTRVRIKEARTTRVKTAFEADVDPMDTTACVRLLEREVAARRLGPPDRWTIQAWHQRRGWIEHRP